MGVGKGGNTIISTLLYCCVGETIIYTTGMSLGVLGCQPEYEASYSLLSRRPSRAARQRGLQASHSPLVNVSGTNNQDILSGQTTKTEKLSRTRKMFRSVTEQLCSPEVA